MNREYLHSVVTEDRPGRGGSPWNECLGLPPHNLFIDNHLSQSCSVQLRYGRSYVNFRIVYLALGEDSKQFVPHAWEGVRSGLYIQDLNLAAQDRDAGLTEASMLVLLTAIAQEHHCELIAESVIGKDDTHQHALEDTYRQDGFDFPVGDRRHAVKRLTNAETSEERCYCGVREEGRKDMVAVNGRPLTMAFELDESYPTGFSWGYGGSGPFQLAVAITRDMYGSGGVWDRTTGAGTPALRAIEQLIVELPAEKDWKLTATQVRRCVDQFNAKVGRVLAS